MTYDCSKLFTDTLQWFSVPERRDELTAYHLNSAPRVSNRVLLAIGYHSEDIIALEYFCPNKSDWTVIKEFQYKYFFSRQTMYFNDYLWIFDNAVRLFILGYFSEHIVIFFFVIFSQRKLI